MVLIFMFLTSLSVIISTCMFLHPCSQRALFLFLWLSNIPLCTEAVAAPTQEQPRGPTPCPRSGVVAEKRYSTCKVRSSGCTLLEQP